MCFRPNAQDSIGTRRFEHERPDQDLEQPATPPGTERGPRGNPEVDRDELARAEEKLASVVGQ